MEQLYNAMLAGVQMPQTAPAAQKGDASQKDGFQKLLEQKADTKTPPKQEKTDAPQDSKPAQGGEKTQETDQPQEVQAVQEDPKELEKQMALAAMAVLQNPVVPAEEAVVVTPEVQAEAVVDEAAPVMAEEVLTPEVQSFAPETEKAVELPVEGGEAQTADQAPVEELPQTIEAPEAAQETEGRTVEVKAETADRTEETADTTEDAPELQDAEAEGTPVFEDVKAVPVKVGEVPKSKEAAQTEDIGRQVGEKLVQITSVSAESGGQKVTVDLDPAYLGKLHVEVGFSEDGVLYVHVNAENSRTQDLLSRNSDSLANILGKYTEQGVRVDVPRQEESQRQDLYEQQQQHHQQRQQEERRRRETSSEDFLQQLRLGLIPLDGE